MLIDAAGVLNLAKQDDPKVGVDEEEQHQQRAHVPKRWQGQDESEEQRAKRRQGTDELDHARNARHAQQLLSLQDLGEIEDAGVDVGEREVNARNEDEEKVKLVPPAGEARLGAGG